MAPGTEFYISIDGVEQVYTSTNEINLTVPLSVRSIEWGFRGKQIIMPEDYYFFNGDVFILPPARPATSLTIYGDFRPWRGFLFW